MQQLADVLAKPSFQKAANNLGWLVAERLARFVLNTMVGFYIARHLGPERLGTLSYCTAVATLIGCVTALGLDAVVKRDLLESPLGHVEILASSGLLRLVAAFGSYGLLFVMEFLKRDSKEEFGLLIVLGLTFFQPALIVPDLWLQTQLKSKLSVWAQTGALAVCSAFRIILVVTDASLAAFAWTIVIESGLSVLGIHVLTRRAGLRLFWSDARRDTMKRLLSEAWPLMFASLAIVVYMKIDEVMLRYLAGPREVGIYSAATRLTEIWYFLPIALATSLLPSLLRARELSRSEYGVRLQQYYDLNAATAYILSIPLALAASWIVRVAYGDAFSAAAPIVAVHVWSCVFVFLGVARGQWLVAERLQRFYFIVTLAGALINIGLNFLLIPRWGGLGAAIATVISQALAAWLSSFCIAATRETAWMQTRAIFVPMLGWHYLHRS
jgi:PST family polysaccharide transporter